MVKCRAIQKPQINEKRRIVSKEQRVIHDGSSHIYKELFCGLVL